MKRSFIKKDKGERVVPFKVLMFLLLIGVLGGTLIFCRLDENGYQAIEKITGGLVENRLNYTFLESLVNSFAGTFILIFLCFIFGYSPLSEPLEYTILVFRGLGLGIVLADMYCSFSVYGIGFSVLLIIPNAVFTALLLLVAVREAVRMSHTVKQRVFCPVENEGSLNFSLYRERFVVLLLGLATASLIDSLLTILITRFIIR